MKMAFAFSFPSRGSQKKVNTFYKSHKKEIFLFFLMLVLELAMIFALWQRSGLNIFFRSDANEFQSIVKNLINYKVFSSDIQAPFYPTNFRTPIYPFWLAIIYLIFGSFKPAIFIGAFVFAISAPLVYLIAKEIFPEKISFIAAILFAIEPWALFQSGFLVAEQIFMPIFLLSIYLFCRYLKFNNPHYLYWASFSLGITALIRPIALFFISIFLFLTFFSELKLSVKSAFKFSALSLFIFVLILSPWLMRNKIILNTWQISSISDVSLYIDNYAMLEKYLGKMKPDENINEVGRILLGTKNYGEAMRSENAKTLARVAIKEIKENAGSYVTMHLKNMALSLVKNSYGNIVLDLKIGDAGIQSKISRSLFKNDFSGTIILIKNATTGSKILITLFFFWPIMILLVFIGIYNAFKKDWRNLLFWFLLLWILYFPALTADILDRSRYKLAINAPLFMMAVYGFYEIKKYLFSYVGNS